MSDRLTYSQWSIAIGDDDKPKPPEKELPPEWAYAKCSICNFYYAEDEYHTLNLKSYEYESECDCCGHVEVVKQVHHICKNHDVRWHSYPDHIHLVHAEPL